MPAGAH